MTAPANSLLRTSRVGQHTHLHHVHACTNTHRPFYQETTAKPHQSSESTRFLLPLPFDLRNINTPVCVGHYLHPHWVCFYTQGQIGRFKGKCHTESDIMNFRKLGFFCSSVKGHGATFCEIHLFAFFPRVSWEERYHSDICTLNMKLAGD